jgi:ribosome modulation factor
VPIPPDVRAHAEVLLDEFCRQHSSAEGTEQPRYVYTFETNAAVLVEERPAFVNATARTSKEIAKFRYSEARNTWAIYWRDANSKWHRVSTVDANKDLSSLLQVVVTDPLGVFWS